LTKKRKAQIEQRLNLKIAVTKMSFEYLKSQTSLDIAESVYTSYIDDRENEFKPFQTVSDRTLERREKRKALLFKVFQELIEKKQVFTKSDLLEKINKRIIDTYLQACLNDFNYQYIKSNRKIKEKYNLSFAGYKYIFIRS